MLLALISIIGIFDDNPVDGRHRSIHLEPTDFV